MENQIQETPAIKGSAGTSRVKPDASNPNWEYNQIVQQIMEKNTKRVLCSFCQGQRNNDTDTKPNGKCSFYTHKKALMDTAEEEMNNPKKEYKHKKEQGARLACYKLWTMLEVGRLGQSRRRPLPVCVEARIKLMKPSDTFQGYKEVKEEETKEANSSDDDTWVGTIFHSPLGSYKKPRNSY